MFALHHFDVCVPRVGLKPFRRINFLRFFKTCLKAVFEAIFGAFSYTVLNV